jgi:hypothetical protein
MRYDSIYPALERDDPRRQLLYMTKADEEFIEVYRQMTPEEQAEMRRLVKELGERSERERAEAAKAAKSAKPEKIKG